MNDQLQTLPPWLWRTKSEIDAHRALLDKMTIRPDSVNVAMVKHPGMVELPLMHFLTWILADLEKTRYRLEMLEMRTGLVELPIPPPD